MGRIFLAGKLGQWHTRTRTAWRRLSLLDGLKADPYSYDKNQRYTDSQSHAEANFDYLCARAGTGRDVGVVSEPHWGGVEVDDVKAVEEVELDEVEFDEVEPDELELDEL